MSNCPSSLGTSVLWTPPSGGSLDGRTLVPGWSMEAKLKNPRISALCDGAPLVRFALEGGPPRGRSPPRVTSEPNSRSDWVVCLQGRFPLVPRHQPRTLGGRDVPTVKIGSFRIRGPPCHVRCFGSIAATYTGARFAPDGDKPKANKKNQKQSLLKNSPRMALSSGRATQESDALKAHSYQ